MPPGRSAHQWTTSFQSRSPDTSRDHGGGRSGSRNGSPGGARAPRRPRADPRRLPSGAAGVCVHLWPLTGRILDSVQDVPTSDRGPLERYHRPRPGVRRRRLSWPLAGAVRHGDRVRRSRFAGVLRAHRRRPSAMGRGRLDLAGGDGQGRVEHAVISLGKLPEGESP